MIFNGRADEQTQIIYRHAPRGEALLEASRTVRRGTLAHAARRPPPRHARDKKPERRSSITSGSIRRPGNDRRAGRHGFDHPSPNGSGHRWENESRALPRNSGFSESPISPMNSIEDDRARGDLLVEILAVGIVDLGCHLELHADRIAISIARSGRFSGLIRPRRRDNPTLVVERISCSGDVIDCPTSCGRTGMRWWSEILTSCSGIR